MAEVVGFIAAVPAFIQLTKYCGELACELYYYSEEREAAKFEIENYANQAKCSSSTIRTSHATLERYHQMHPESMVLRELGTEGTLTATLAMSKNISTRLKSVTDNLIDQNGTHYAAVRYIKWRLRKKGVLEILLQLDRVQSNMQLIINILSIEASELEIKRITTMTERRVNKGMDTKIKALEKHIREQRRVIEDQLKTISQMEEQARRYGIDQEEISYGQRALYRIGNSIIVGGKVSLYTERGSRRRNLSRSSSSTSGGSSTSSFRGPIIPRHPGGPGGSGGPTPTNKPPTASSADASDFSQYSVPDDNESHRKASPITDQSKSNNSRKAPNYQKSKSPIRLAGETAVDSFSSSDEFLSPGNNTNRASGVTTRKAIPDRWAYKSWAESNKELEQGERERQERERQERERQEQEQRKQEQRKQEQRKQEQRKQEQRKQEQRKQEQRKQEQREQEQREQEQREQEQREREKREQEQRKQEQRERESLEREIRERKNRKNQEQDRELVYRY